MAGKSWQISHEPPGPQGKTGTHHTDKTVEKTKWGREAETEASWRQKTAMQMLALGLHSKNIVYSVSTWTPGPCTQIDTTGHLCLFIFIQETRNL